MASEDVLNPESYIAVDGYWQFDRQFYEEFGLNLAPFEDPSEGALMPKLRRTASLVVEASTRTNISEAQQERVEGMLVEAHSAVGYALARAQRAVRFDDMHLEHPAVGRWVERNEAKDNPSTKTPEQVFGFGGAFRNISLGLVRPLMPEIDPDYFTSPFSVVSRPNANFYHSPLDETIPQQLTLARAGVFWDI